MNNAKRLWVLIALLAFAGILRATLPQTMVGTWTSAPSLLQARANAAAVMLSDGRILITGGDAGSGALQSAEIFGTSGVVSAAGSMNVSRSGHFAVVLGDGRVLVGGGNSSGGGATNSAEIYDPSNDSWTQTSPMTQGRAGATAALLQDGRVLIAGGDNSGTPSNTVEIFDPSTGNFTFAGTLSSPRTRHAMAVLQDGRVLIVGGSDGTNPLASSDIFDPATGNVSSGPSLATARYGHSATTLLDGRVAVIGGTDGANDLASAEIYDPATGGVSNAGAALATAREGHQAFLLANNNNVLIVGGTSGGAAVAASELFIPQISSSGVWSSSFSATGANVAARTAAVGSAMQQDGLLLAAGGNDASGNALASTELYAFPTVKTDQADYAPGSIVTITGSGWQPGETVTLTLVESPLIDTHPAMTAVADVNGNISNNQFVPDVYDVSVRFYLTAVGSQSGLQAGNTFTDAGPKPSSTITFPGNGGSYSSPGWTAGAPIAGAVSFASGTTGRVVNVSIKRNGATNKYWNGTSFTSAPEVFFSAALNGGQTAWSLTFPTTNFPADDSYTIHSQAVDSNGTETGTTASTFTLDNAAPAGPPAPSLASGSDSGASQSDEITDITANLKFSGSAEANSTINLFVDGSSTATGTGTVNNGGAYNNVNIPGPFSEGTHTIRATATDQAANTSALGSALSITVDATPPTMGLTPASGTVNTPFSFSWGITDPTTGGVSSGVNPATCKATVDAVQVSTACSGNHSITTAGSHTVVVSASDIAGNASSDTRSYTVVTDNQAPVVTVTFPSPVNGSGGWYNAQDTVPVVGTVSADDTTTGNGNVTAISCTGATVGTITGLNTHTASASLTVSGDGVHNVSCTATDSAGNTGASAGSTMPVVIKIDTTAPTLNGIRLTAANANGWNNTNVGVEFTCTDSTSLVASINAIGAASGSSSTSPLDAAVSTEGSGQSVSGSCKDNAGNSAAPASVTGINIDKTKPLITGSRNPAPNAFGWNNVDVTVTFTCSEAGVVQSGVATDTVAGATVTTEGMNQSVTNTGTCTDIASNTASSATVSGINIDKTAPNAPTVMRTPSANGAGWNNTDVLVSFNSNGDAGAVQSGIDTCTTSSTLTAETNGTDVSGTCTDRAGNTSTTATVTVKIDKTAPVITGSRNPAPNAFGWNNVDVTVTFTCSETGVVQSGVATNTVAGATVTTEGMNQSVTNTGSCGDAAGNAASSATVNSVNIDKTKPTANAAVSPGPNAFGWNNGDVTVTFSGNDSLSGIASCDTPVTLSTEGTNLSASGTCKDKADNVSDPAAATGINIDKTKPAITGSRTPLANAYGWNNTDVTVTFVCADSGPVQSGLNVNSVAGATVSGEGANQSVTNTGSCTDKAGNTADPAGVGSISIDKTNPTITPTITPGSPAVTGWYNISTGKPTVTFSCGDTLSGVASCDPPILVPEGANQTIAGTAMDKAGNGASTSIMHVNVDVTAPTISLTAPASGGSYVLNQTLNAAYACSDAGSSGLLAGSAGCGGPAASGSQFDTASVGSKTFTVNAKDVAGNAASQTNTYGVFYSTGPCLGSPGHTILQPINFTGDSVFPKKQGSTVPAKFRVCDANGVSIGAPGVVMSFSIINVFNGTVYSSPTETLESTTPDTAFRWTGDQWIFNISTKNLSAGSTYYFRVALNDGTNVDFDFGLK